MVLALFLRKSIDSENWIKGTCTGVSHCEWSKYKGFPQHVPSTN